MCPVQCACVLEGVLKIDDGRARTETCSLRDVDCGELCCACADVDVRLPECLIDVLPVVERVLRVGEESVSGLQFEEKIRSEDAGVVELRLMCIGLRRTWIVATVATGGVGESCCLYGGKESADAGVHLVVGVASIEEIRGAEAMIDADVYRVAEL